MPSETVNPQVTDAVTQAGAVRVKQTTMSRPAPAA